MDDADIHTNADIDATVLEYRQGIVLDILTRFYFADADIDDSVLVFRQGIVLDILMRCDLMMLMLILMPVC